MILRLQQSAENETKTEAARGRYLPVATRGAVLYFVLADLEVLNSMYQFSLQWFTEKFLQCVGGCVAVLQQCNLCFRRNIPILGETCSLF